MRSLQLVLTVLRNPETRTLARVVMEGAGHRVIESGGSMQAQALLRNGLKPDLILVECVPGTLAELVDSRQFAKSASAACTCLVTGEADQDVRKRATKMGIQSFLTTPVTRESLESLIAGLGVPGPEGERKVPALAKPQPLEICAAQRPVNSSEIPSIPYIEELGEGRFFLAASPVMLKIHQQVKMLAKVDVNVLILGESGTGKEVIAHLIHKNSPREREKFLNVNCAALPEDLLESELFGHRQGAFTGAIRDRAGKFEQANRGTLLLDEIGEIPVRMQAKLLHVLQDGQFTRLGGQESTKVDVRVVAATNIQIDKALQEKVFREDLYYRLSAFTICVPPLRERREEIPFLMEETIRRAPAEMTSGAKDSLPSRLMDVALLYDWRGNLRELRNFVTRALIMRDSDAAVRELEAKIAAATLDANQHIVRDAASHRSGMRSVVRDVKDRTEAQMIQEALEVFGWNRRRAAQYLNISYRGLLYKIQRHRLAPTSSLETKSEYQRAFAVRNNST